MADGGRKWLKLAGSVAVTGALCAWAFRNADWAGQWQSLKTAHYGWLVPYVGVLLGIHLFRTLRWGALLSGMERVPFRQLNQASGIGFMMLLILPFRLGEFARPFLIAQRSTLRRSAAMATVVVERITDGLLIAVLLRSLLFFVDSRSPGIDRVLLGSNLLFVVFGGGALFLLFATWQQARAVALVRMTAGKVSPALADKVAHVVGMFVGAMRQLPPAPQLVLFLVYTLAYWGLNGLGMALLSRAFTGAELTVFQGFVVLSVLIVFLMIPAAPGMVGTFQGGIVLGMSLFLPAQVVNASGLAYANVMWLAQTAQQVVVGLLLLATSHTRFSDVASQLGPEEAPGTDAASPS
ncbi:MAG: hypothetical protein RL653_2104 [Pseudomonadota bacterium]|jgi:hypothetical protein